MDTWPAEGVEFSSLAALCIVIFNNTIFANIETTHARFWRSIVLFVTIPVLVLMSAYVYTREQEKKREPRPPFVDVPYLRRMVKPFPWGDGKHSFFHNPEKNPISPHGYEVEDPNEVKTGQQEN
ncbi:cytochrome c oxidase subunit 6A1, mitochondrial [Calliopsis andreniformis]|uniref:cytochrome c oxidase subunit 6A1, mitochondrial n=1 Tax=Calliopsis andreniformis TaxID=337506 RepID=UPI003FCCEABD